jgi:transcriptional regulator GlxA family with amidase domain
MHRVAILCFEGLVAFDVTAPAQAFGLAHRRGGEPLYEVSTCSPGGDQVTTTSGFSIAPSEGLKATRHADTVVVPGYAGLLAPPPAPSSTPCARPRPAAPG